ncbi:hypothetical protein NQ314_016649 [Rhamnusium bicolor]|uniref:Uncharacterized protein n=1 Tax=Rhamnusium bicolor TaxID=1586634 RepID=A0AAV8WY38_9CUCU|nr:hypothetical protein NQ314_016649 [Rhamnusium bicolor]
MPLNSDAIIEVCEVISQQEHLKVTIKQTAKGAVITGLGALSGGLLGGPVGMAIGKIFNS